MGTHSALSGPSEAAVSSALDPPALNGEPEGGDAEPSLVGCQFASTEDARQIADSEDADMRRVSHDKKPFQSKLTLTLRNPEAARRSPSRPSTPQPVVLKHQEPRLKTFAPQPCTSTGNLFNSTDIPESKTSRVLGSSTSLDGLTVPKINTMTRKIPPAPPPRTSSCPAVSAGLVPAPPIGVTALHHRAFRKGKSTSMSSQHESDREHHQTTDSAPSQYSSTNPLLLSEPVATSSPTPQPKFSAQKPGEKPKLRKQNSVRSITQEETTDDGTLNQLVRKPSKSSKTESERSATRKLRKQSQISLTSLDHNLNNPLCDRTRFLGLNNVSISSSSGLESPTKTDRRKRRVSIKFNKRTSSFEEDRPGILTNFRSKSREETDGTTSDRERTNSVSSRTSSLTRRKLSSSSSRTIFQEEKIPWCGCWGNGCV